MNKSIPISRQKIGLALCVSMSVISSVLIVLFLKTDADTRLIKLVDATLQQYPMYEIRKREFPEWYGRHRYKLARHIKNGASTADIARFTEKQSVAFMRTYGQSALYASSEKLDAVLDAELRIIRQLENSNTAACAEYVINGQLDRIELLQKTDRTNFEIALQSKATKITEAIVDGRKQNIEYGKPTTADSRVFMAHFYARGWTDAEVLLVSDRARLAVGPSETACVLFRRFNEVVAALEPSSTRSRFLVAIMGPRMRTWTARAMQQFDIISYS